MTEQSSVKDGSGGVVIAFATLEQGASRVRLQRLDVRSVPAFAAGGILACASPAGEQSEPEVVVDSDGNFVVVWVDTRMGSPNLFAQSFTPAGQMRWPGAGLQVAQTGTTKLHPRLVADPTGGGVTVYWIDNYVRVGWQHLTTLGTPAVGAGRIVRTAAGGATWLSDLVARAASPAGSTVAAWNEGYPLTAQYSVWTNRFDASGASSWPTPGGAGVRIGKGAWSQTDLDLAAAADGATIYAYTGFLPVSGASDRLDLRVARVGPDGALSWNLSKHDELLQSPPQGLKPRVVPDGAGGALLAASFLQVPVVPDPVRHVWAARVQSNGVFAWGWTPAGSTASASLDVEPRIARDGPDDLVVSWTDRGDVRAQKLTLAGGKLWANEGEVLASGAASAEIAPDGVGGAIASWIGTGGDLFAQHRHAPSVPVTLTTNANPSSPGSFVRTCPAGDADGLNVSVDFDDARIGRPIQPDELTLVPVNVSEPPTRDIAFFAGGPIAATIAARQENGYATTIQHRHISGYGEAWTDVQLDGVSIGQAFMRLKSPDLALLGTVNLADVGLFSEALNATQDPRCDYGPYAPPTLTGDGDVDMEDVAFFSAHIGHTQPFGAPGGSAISHPVEDGAGAPPTIAQGIQLWQNQPNPFASSTTIRFALARPARVRVAVYSLGGGLVKEILDGPREAGTHFTAWDGTTADGRPAPSGVYFYRLVAGGVSQVRRLVLLR